MKQDVTFLTTKHNSSLLQKCIVSNNINHYQSISKIDRVCVCIGVNICVCNAQFVRYQALAPTVQCTQMLRLCCNLHLFHTTQQNFMKGCSEKRNQSKDILKHPEHEQVSGFPGFKQILYCDISQAYNLILSPNV